PHLDSADATVVEVGEIEAFTLGIERDSIDTAKLCLAGRAIVAAVAFLAGASELRHDARFQIELADAIVPRVREEQVAAGRHGQAVHAVERGLGGRFAVAAVALLIQCATQDAQNALAIYLEHAATPQLNEIGVAGLVEVHAERPLELRLGGQGTAAVVAAPRNEHQP